MCLMAFRISINGVITFNDSDCICCNSSSEGGISFVVCELHQTDAIEHTAPRKNEAKTQVGNLPVVPTKISGKMNNDTLANVCPKPVKKLCA